MNWVDWIKAIGMFLIVYGHTFPEKWSIYIYTFSVPLFFIISGFLSKRENDYRVFWKKIFFNMILPVIIIVTFSFLYYTAKHLRAGDYDAFAIFKFFVGSLIGLQKYLGTCWFVYTLIVLKVLHQFTPPYCEKKLIMIILLVFSTAAIALSYYNCFLGNSLINVLISYPFFVFGNVLGKYKAQINNFHNRYIEILIFLLSIFFVYICAKYNGEVWVYINDYGNNFILYLLGGIFGFALVFVVSKWLNRVNWSIVHDISTGSILILGFHLVLLGKVINYIGDSFITSVIILLVFVPVIRICKKYFPYILGIYRI